MNDAQKVVVTTSRDEIRERIANAIRTLSNVEIDAIGDDGISQLSFRVTSTDHDSKRLLSTVIGVLDPRCRPSSDTKEIITVFIPTTGEITATINLQP